MANWKLFWLIINRNITMLSISLFFILGSVISTFFLINDMTKPTDLTIWQTLNAILLGLGCFVLFISTGDRLRNFLAYNFNHMLPNYRLTLLKSVGVCYSLFLLLPIIGFYWCGGLSNLQCLTIIFICTLSLLVSLFNQTISTIITLISLYLVTIELFRVKKDPTYLAFDYLPFSIEVSLIILTLIAILIFIVILLWLPKEFFGISKGKSTNGSKNIEGLVSQNVILKYIRQKKLSYYYDLKKYIHKINGNINIYFWNYQFTSLITLRTGLFIMAFYLSIFQQDIWIFLTNSIEYSSNNLIANSISNTFTIGILIVFGVFDGANFATQPNATRFLWLKYPSNGLQSFINMIYVNLAKIATKEIIFSYLAFALVLNQIGLEYFDMLLLTLSFFTIKIVNLILIQILTGVIEKRWVTIAIAVTNLTILLGLSLINNQTLIDQSVAIGLIFTTVLVSGIIYLKSNYQKQISKLSLI